MDGTQRDIGAIKQRSLEYERNVNLHAHSKSDARKCNKLVYGSVHSHFRVIAAINFLFIYLYLFNNDVCNPNYVASSYCVINE